MLRDVGATSAVPTWASAWRRSNWLTHGASPPADSPPMFNAPSQHIAGRRSGLRSAARWVSGLAKVLAMAPDEPKARDPAGSAAWEQRDFRQAALHWRQFLTKLPL